MATHSGSDYCESTKRNTMRLALWTFAWLISMALVNFGPTLLWGENVTLTWIAVVINLIFGLVMIWANKVYLMSTDELQQRIQLQAMGITLGIGLVGGLAYANLDTTNLISGDAEIAHLVMLMGFTYIVALIASVRQYQ